jgi:hypothetical protein
MAKLITLAHALLPNGKLWTPETLTAPEPLRRTHADQKVVHFAF